MNAPVLRFRDEEGRAFPEWEEKRLGEIATFSKGRGISKSDIDANGETLCIRYGELYTDYGTTIQFVRSKTNVNLKTLVLSEVNDVIIPASGETQIDIATASCVQLSGVALGGDLNIIKSGENGVFLAYYLNSQKKLDIARLAQGNSVVHLYSSQLRLLDLKLPSKCEQTKIANFLTAVDEKISQLTQKHALLTQYKKGVMQQIFSQTLRFKDDDGREFPTWMELRLGDVAKITTGSSNRVDSTIEGGAYTFFDRSQDIRTSNIYLFDCEAIIVAGEGQEFIPKYFAGKFDLHQRTYAIMNFQGFDGKYLFYFIHWCSGYFLSQAVGSTVKSLRLPMFQRMLVWRPCRAEQTKIAQFLTALDDKLAATQVQLDGVKRFKQGLLQQMFV